MFAKIVRGMIAGFIATVVLSLMMLTKDLIPQLEAVRVLDSISREFFSGSTVPIPMAGWMWHFLIGTLWWGGWFGIIEPIVPGRRPWLRGLYFGLVLGILVIWAVLPLAGAGALGMHATPLQSVVTLIQHMVYGIVLGLGFGRLGKAAAGA